MVIFGAGNGLGVEIARKFSGEGYQVALVARRPEPLEAFAAQLREGGATAEAFPADLTDLEGISALLGRIRGRFGSIDGLYFGPSGSYGFRPAADFTVEYVHEVMTLLFESLVAIVSDVLPEMRSRGDGLILVGQGGSAAQGIPFMSGPGTAMAAARNYLQSLHGELVPAGIRVAMLTITALILNSDSHRAVMSGQIKIDLPEGFALPEVEPKVLAGILVDAAAEGRVEAFFPPA
jgi:short-subunit dehydrogenase